MTTRDRVALITGVNGQDGSYAAELLQARGYAVVGTTRGPGVKAAVDRIVIETWDVRDHGRFRQIVERHRPSEIYNFAAYSTGIGMYDDPIGIGEVNGLAVAGILEAIRIIDPRIRFCQASSSEMFGEPLATPQNEDTPFNPRSPYGAAKLYAHNMVGIFRERYGLFACSAILFNHESPRRGLAFVTRKIAHAAASIKLGLSSELRLGNLEGRRDWGFARDAVEATFLMLQGAGPSDFVVATGLTHSVREFCTLAFKRVGLDYRDHVRTESSDYRPSEARQLVGDRSKASRVLGWGPTLSFEKLVHMMVDAELERLSLAISD